VHGAQHHQHHAHLPADALDRHDAVSRFVVQLEEQADKADVDQVEADHEQVIDAVRDALVVEGLDQEDAAITAQGLGDPDGQGDGDGQVGQVRARAKITCSFLWPRLDCVGPAVMRP